MGSNLGDFFDRGEEDAFSGKYKLPHYILVGSLASLDEIDAKIRENQFYNKGHIHGRGQEDASNDVYSPPIVFRDFYDEAWENRTNNP